jgi:HSP20 family molecular chaperone IbpA
MIGDIQIRIGGTALTARLGYEGVMARSLGRLLRQPARRRDFKGPAPSNFSVSETLEKVTIVFKVPGYDRHELLLEATPHSLRLRNAELPPERQTGDALDHVVQIVEAVVPESVAATLQNGILTVELPKAAWVEGRARRVTIETTDSVPPAQQQDQPYQHT